MQRFVCEICGNSNLVKNSNYFVCQNCGTKYTLEDAKKMMTEDTVSIDRSRELDNLYILARRAKQEGNTENAAKYYSQIVELSPNDPEAYFYSVYYQALNCKIGEIGVAANNIKNAFRSTVDILRREHKIYAGNTDELIEYAEAVISFAKSSSNTAENHYIQYLNVSNTETQAIGWILNCVNAVITVGNTFYELDDRKNAVEVYKAAVICSRRKVNVGNEVLRRIKETDPYYNVEIVNESSSGMFTKALIIMVILIIIFFIVVFTTLI